MTAIAGEAAAARDRATKRTINLVAVLICIAATLLLQIIQKTEADSVSRHSDFDAFYVAAKLVWQGRIVDAYHYSGFVAAQRAVLGQAFALTWTYPPQFDLLIAPLALVSRGTAYAIFMTVSLAAYLLALRKLSGQQFALVLAILFVPIFVVELAGQNGLVTGALIGLTCIALGSGNSRRRTWAGVPLGLMIIKPHLAVAFACYVLVSRQWRVALVAAAVIVLTSLAATLLLGSPVWSAFLGAVRESSAFLKSGFYPYFRMVSPYSAAQALGASAFTAFAAQAIVAVTALILVAVAHRCLPVSQALGITAIASLLISPYAYDYDLPAAGVGLALLLPDLARNSRMIERVGIGGLLLFAASYGLVQELRFQDVSGGAAAQYPPAPAGIALVAAFAAIWIVLRRQPLKPAPQ